MSTRNYYSQLVRALAGVLIVGTAAGCGSEMLRTGRAPVFLVVESVSTSSGGGTGSDGSFLLSDVQQLVDQTVNGVTVQVATVFNDNASIGLRVEPKSQNVETVVTPLNAVTLTRYHVEFKRADGRNTPGVDVPYGFDGGLGVTIQPNTSGTIAFELVRHQSKLEPPLKNLVGTGGLGFISTIAEVTIYGHDQNGNEVSAVVRINVNFGDFADD